ncbi:MAG: S41 family peptidase [Planctomycetota bacterium]|jgi:carboxyl-terminal processing protease
MKSTSPFKTAGRAAALVPLLTLLAALAACAPDATRAPNEAPQEVTSAAPAAAPVHVEPERSISRAMALDTFDEVWQTIQDTHFDPDHLEAIGWEQARSELRPRAADSLDDEQLREVLRELLERLEQSHFAIIPGDRVDLLALDEDEPAESDPAAPSDDRDRPAAGDDTTAAPRPAATPETGGAAPPSTAADRPTTTAESTTGDDAPASQVADRDEAPADGGDDPDRSGAVGVDVRLIDGQVLVTRVDAGSPADAAGIRTGWIVQRVGSREIARLLERFPDDFDDRMRDLYAQRAVMARIDGRPGTTVDLAFRDGDDRSVERTLERRSEEGVASKIGNLPVMICRTESRTLTTDASRVGYIWFNIWLVPIMAPVREAVDRHRSAEGIVIDLRGNPGGLGGMAMSVAGHFLDDNVKLGTITVRGAAPLNFVAFPQRVSLAGERVSPFAGPLAILVDGQSGSTSEIFAGGMQSIGRARIFGQTTMGAALPARMPRLPNGDVLLHAFADYVDANGVRLEARGVVPDEAVAVTRADLLAGRDPVLQAALDWIDSRPVQSAAVSAE